MFVKFWGVRGSIPTPLTSQQVRNRIASVIHRIKPDDLSTPESKEIFLSTLPHDIFGTVGGNTTCIEVRADASLCLIFDAGTGLRELGKYYVTERKTVSEFHIFFTHFHWDHIQGIPFFAPLFDKKNKIYFYSPVPHFDAYVKDQMKFPYFPIELEFLPAEKHFIELEGRHKSIKGISIDWRRMKHPGGCFSYKVTSNEKSVIIATDSEITEKEFEQVAENISFFRDAHMLILDSQYTLTESINKIDWGHSSYSIDVDLASVWKVKNLVLFHHEPLYTDKKVLSIERLSKWYLNHLENKNIKITIAVEGKELEV